MGHRRTVVSAFCADAVPERKLGYRARMRVSGALLGLFWSSFALAQTTEPTTTTATDPDAAKPEKREPLHLSFDWTLGFGKVDVVDQRSSVASNALAPAPTR